MKKKSGFTLVEVIVSLAVLGIIALASLGAISAHFSYIKSTMRITQNDFLAQELMEQEIDDAKVRVTSPTAALKSTTLFSSSLGGINVKYEELKISHENKDYYTLVSNVRPDPLDIIYLKSIGVKLNQGTTQVQDDYYAYPMNQFKVIGNFENDNLFKFDHLLNQVEWYISSEKYNMPLPKNQSVSLNDDEFYYYPRFPRDYEIFSNETIYKFGASESTFNSLNEIAGRHIIYAVTPAAKSGKLGTQLISKPIYISGLPINTNLITHLDASYIDALSNTNEAQIDGTDYVLKLWYDISSIIGRSAPNEVATSPSTNSLRPLVKRSASDDQFIGQYVKFQTGQYMQINNQGISGNRVYIYVVLKNRSNDASKYIVNGLNEVSIAASTAENLNQWHIVRKELVLDGTTIKIGDSDVDIAEVLIYLDSVDVDDNTKILEYLSKKYYSNILVTD